MKITRRCDYALRALIYLAYCQDIKQYKVTSKEVSTALDIPFKVLSTVLVQLRQGKFIRSSRGVKGGYFLEKSPNDVTLYDVIHLIDGEIGNYTYRFTETSSNDALNAIQVIKGALETVQGTSIQTMRKITLRELATMYHKLVKEDLSYSI